MTDKQIQNNEAEYAGFVDQGTRVVLQEAVQKIVESFAQTDALEDIVSYLEEMREGIYNSDERVKEVQQKEKQINDRITMLETSIRNLLQRIQEMEVQVARASEQMDEFVNLLVKLTGFFEQPPLKRMFGKLESDENQGE